MIDIGPQASFIEDVRRLALRWNAGGRGEETVQMDLWYAGRWWSLSDNLPAFAAWLRATETASAEAVERFATNPLDQPQLLFLAVEQMRRLLRAGTARP